MRENMSSDLLATFASEVETLKTINSFSSVSAQNRAKLPNWIRTGQSLENFLEFLTDAQRETVFSTLIENVDDFLKQADLDTCVSFFRLLPEGPLEQAFLSHWAQTIQKAEDLAYMLELFPLKQGKIVHAFKMHLQRLIVNGQDLSKILLPLTEPLSELVLDACDTYLSELFKNIDNRYYFLKSLGRDQLNGIESVFERYFFTLIKGSADLANILRYSQNDDLLRWTVGRGCALGHIRSITDIYRILPDGEDWEKKIRQEKLIIDICFRELSLSLLKTPEDLRSALYFFEKTENSMILEMCYPKIPEFIGEASSNVALKFAEQGASLSVQEQSFARLVQWVNRSNFSEIHATFFKFDVGCYSEEMRDKIITVVCTRLFQFIKEGDFFDMLAILQFSTRMGAATNRIQEGCLVRIPEFIKTAADLLRVLRTPLTEEAFNKFQKKIPLYIKGKQYFDEIYGNLQGERREAIQFSIAQYMQDFTIIYNMLYENQHSFFKTHQPIWFSLSVDYSSLTRDQLLIRLENIHAHADENKDSRTTVALKILEDIYRGNLDKSALLKKAICVSHSVSDAGTFVTLKKGDETSRFWKSASLERALEDDEATVDASVGRAKEIQESVNRLSYFQR